MGTKTQQNFLCIRCKKDNPKNRCSPLVVMSLSLYALRYSSERLYVQIRTIAPLFIHNNSIDFYTIKFSPTKFYGTTSPRKTQNNILYYLLGY